MSKIQITKEKVFVDDVEIKWIVGLRYEESGENHTLSPMPGRLLIEVLPEEIIVDGEAAVEIRTISPQSKSDRVVWSASGDRTGGITYEILADGRYRVDGEFWPIEDAHPAIEALASVLGTVAKL